MPQDPPGNHRVPPDRSPPDRSPPRPSLQVDQTGAIPLQGPQVDEEAAPWLQILAQDPGRADAHRALWGVYRRRGDEERAQTELAALCFLRQATTEEVAQHERQRSARLHRCTGVLNEDAWIGCVYRSDQSRLLSALSAVVSGPLALRKALEARRYGLQPEERRAAAGEQTLFGNVFSYTARLLGVPAPDLYYRPEERAPLRLANISEGGRLLPAVVVGQPLLSGVGEKELAFRCAQFLAKLRPEHLLRLLLPTLGELRLALRAALLLAQEQLSGQAPPLGSTPDAVVEAYREQLRDALPAAGLLQLRRIVEITLRDAPEGARPDEGAWVQAVDGTAQRAALIACGDLELALQVTAREPADAGALPIPVIERQRELLRYAASPRYHAARRYLGC